jgi:hypothetical protein
MFFEQVGANPKHLRPLDVVMPMKPKYTSQEWQEMYAAQKKKILNFILISGRPYTTIR